MHFLSRALTTPCAILVERTMKNNPVNYFECRPVVLEELPFKVISFLELWQPFCSAARNHLCYFGRVCYEKTFCEINVVCATSKSSDQPARTRSLIRAFASRLNIL